MAQRMGNITEWVSLEGNEAAGAFFPGRERVVAFEVNAPAPVALWATSEEMEDRFVALVEGRDRVEFAVPGDFTLYVTGGDLWYKTVDGSVAVNVEVAPIVFTRIANRKVRNHNLEMMEFQMRRNLEARMLQMEADARQRLEDTERQYAASRRPVVLARADESESLSESEGITGKQPSKAPPGKGGADDGEGGGGGKADKSRKSTASASDD